MQLNNEKNYFVDFSSTYIRAWKSGKFCELQKYKKFICIHEELKFKIHQKNLWNLLN